MIVILPLVNRGVSRQPTMMIARIDIIQRVLGTAHRIRIKGNTSYVGVLPNADEQFPPALPYYQVLRQLWQSRLSISVGFNNQDLFTLGVPLLTDVDATTESLHIYLHEGAVLSWYTTFTRHELGSRIVQLLWHRIGDRNPHFLE